jgi:hypothetical protein
MKRLGFKIFFDTIYITSNFLYTFVLNIKNGVIHTIPYTRCACIYFFIGEKELIHFRDRFIQEFFRKKRGILYKL